MLGDFGWMFDFVFFWQRGDFWKLREDIYTGIWKMTLHHIGTVWYHSICKAIYTWCKIRLSESSNAIVYKSIISSQTYNQLSLELLRIQKAQSELVQNPKHIATPKASRSLSWKQV